MMFAEYFLAVDYKCRKERNSKSTNLFYAALMVECKPVREQQI